MTNTELQKLARDTEDFHPGMKCHFAEAVFLPYREYTPDVWAIEKTGPRQMDKIFFGLLENGVDTQEKIAKQLGVEENEFILTHLDILIHDGYVAESANSDILTLTEQGLSFDSGKFQEKGLKKIKKFRFIWDDMTACIKPDIKFTKRQANYLKTVKHGEDPDEDDIMPILAEHFNKKRGEVEKVTFYNVANPDVGQRRFPYRKKYAEYAALFYVSKKEQNDLCRIDLRIQNDSGEFDPCKDLSDMASEKNSSWYKKFEKIYTEAVKKSIPKW